MPTKDSYAPALDMLNSIAAACQSGVMHPLPSPAPYRLDSTAASLEQFNYDNRAAWHNVIMAQLQARMTVGSMPMPPQHYSSFLQQVGPPQAGFGPYSTGQLGLGSGAPFGNTLGFPSNASYMSNFQHYGSSLPVGSSPYYTTAVSTGTAMPFSPVPPSLGGSSPFCWPTPGLSCQRHASGLSSTTSSIPAATGSTLYGALSGSHQQSVATWPQPSSRKPDSVGKSPPPTQPSPSPALHSQDTAVLAPLAPLAPVSWKSASLSGSSSNDSKAKASRKSLPSETSIKLTVAEMNTSAFLFPAADGEPSTHP